MEETEVEQVRDCFSVSCSSTFTRVEMENVEKKTVKRRGNSMKTNRRRFTRILRAIQEEKSLPPEQTKKGSRASTRKKPWNSAWRIAPKLSSPKITGLALLLPRDSFPEENARKKVRAKLCVLSGCAREQEHSKQASKNRRENEANFAWRIQIELFMHATIAKKNRKTRRKSGKIWFFPCNHHHQDHQEFAWKNVEKCGRT